MKRKWFLGGLVVVAAVALESAHSQRYSNFFTSRSYDSNPAINSNNNNNANNDGLNLNKPSRAKSTILEEASNAISDTVSAALSWDPTGILENSVSPATELSAASSSKFKQRQRRKKHRRRKNGSRRKPTRPNRYNNNDDYYEDNEDRDDDYYYDRDDGYSAPDAGGYSAPSSGYNEPSSGYGAPSYEAPAPSYSAPSYEAPAPSYSAPSYSAPSSGYGAPPSYGGGGGGNDFNDFLNALAAFLPIALFLAAIPPNLITINTGRRKKRGLEEQTDQEMEYDFPFIHRIQELGASNVYESTECQKKLFCEMATFDRENEKPNFVQKLFHWTTESSPKFLSNVIGTTDVFEAAKSKHCDLFKC